MPIALVGRSVRVLTAISLIAVVVACLVVPASAQEEDDFPAWTRELQEMVREIMAAQAAVEDALRAGKAGRAWAAIERGEQAVEAAAAAAERSKAAAGDLPDVEKRDAAITEIEQISQFAGSMAGIVAKARQRVEERHGPEPAPGGLPADDEPDREPEWRVLVDQATGGAVLADSYAALVAGAESLADQVTYLERGRAQVERARELLDEAEAILDRTELTGAERMQAEEEVAVARELADEADSALREVEEEAGIQSPPPADQDDLIGDPAEADPWFDESPFGRFLRELDQLARAAADPSPGPASAGQPPGEGGQPPAPSEGEPGAELGAESGAGPGAGPGAEPGTESGDEPGDGGGDEGQKGTASLEADLQPPAVRPGKPRDVRPAATGAGEEPGGRRVDAGPLVAPERPGGVVSPQGAPAHTAGDDWARQPAGTPAPAEVPPVPVTQPVPAATPPVPGGPQPGVPDDWALDATGQPVTRAAEPVVVTDTPQPVSADPADSTAAMPSPPTGFDDEGSWLDRLDRVAAPAQPAEGTGAGLRLQVVPGAPLVLVQPVQPAAPETAVTPDQPAAPKIAVTPDQPTGREAAVTPEQPAEPGIAVTTGPEPAAIVLRTAAAGISGGAGATTWPLPPVLEPAGTVRISAPGEPAPVPDTSLHLPDCDGGGPC